MQCQHAQELFSDYVGGQTDRALSVSLDNHLAECAHCREEVAGMRRVWETLDHIADVDPPPFFRENLMARLDAERVQAEEAALRKRALWDWRLLLRPRTLASAAAALVLLLACVEVVQTQRAELGPVGWVVQMLHPTPPNLNMQTAYAQWLPGAPGGTLIVHLRPEANADRHTNLLSYRLTAPGHLDIMSQGNLTSNQETVLSLTVPETPAGPLALSLTVHPREDTTHVNAIPLTVPIPAANNEEPVPSAP